MSGSGLVEKSKEDQRMDSKRTFDGTQENLFNGTPLQGNHGTVPTDRTPLVGITTTPQSQTKKQRTDSGGTLNSPLDEIASGPKSTESTNTTNPNLGTNILPQFAGLDSSTLMNTVQLKMAEQLARQLHESLPQQQQQISQPQINQTTKTIPTPTEQQQSIRKSNEEQWINFRAIRNKVEEMRQKVEDEEKAAAKSNKELYTLFNDLQGIAKDLNISFDSPEIVVIGMQSDGKSSFVEGLLGFQFNIVESSKITTEMVTDNSADIGTRRPLILQMINNPDRDTPKCRFRKENPMSDSDPFEEYDTPVHRLVDEIVRRTNDRAGASPDKVSDVPIILRVEYCNCANLTIYDTPGFRLGGNEQLKTEIQNMVMKLIQPKHRIIVCLEQSTVEWANSVSRPMAKQIDPDFSRTILVNTKFDNRVKELRNKDSADKYLSGENLPEGVKPFFISMPLRRDLDSNRFRDAIREAFLDDYSKLLEVGFDEDKFCNQLGLFKVKTYLERLLHEKYTQNLVPTLRILEDICRRSEQDLSQVKNELEQHDTQLLKSKATTYVQTFATMIDNLLAGSIAGHPEKNGETLQEEKMNSAVSDWPDFNIDFDIQNAKLKIYGGAQYARLINEFEYVAHSREFPRTTPSEIASALGTSKWHSVPISETAAANLVQMKAKQVFLPLIDIVLQRCSYLMKKLFPIAVDVLKHDSDHKGIGILSVYERFVHELRTTYESFIDKIENDCRARLKDDFVMFTKIVDWEMLHSGSADSGKEYSYLESSPEETKQRVREIMERKGSVGINRAASLDEDGYKQIALLAAKMFAGIRFFFAKYVRNKLNAFFLDPMLQEVGAAVVNHFHQLSQKKYEDMFIDGVEELKEIKVKLEKQLALCSQQRDRFKEVYNRTKALH